MTDETTQEGAKPVAKNVQLSHGNIDVITVRLLDGILTELKMMRELLEKQHGKQS